MGEGKFVMGEGKFVMGEGKYVMGEEKFDRDKSDYGLRYHPGLIATWLIAEALAYAWSRRQNDRPILIEEMKNILRTKASFMAASSRFASAGKKLSNIIWKSTQK